MTIFSYQTQGSIFGEGISDLGLKMRNASSAAYSDREGGAGSSGAMEKPRLGNNVLQRLHF